MIANDIECEDVLRVLDSFDVDYVIKRNRNNEAYTCTDVARERDIRLSQVLKCMVGKDSDNAIYIMLIPGDNVQGSYRNNRKIN